MIVGRTTDIDEIKSILCHDDIFNDISEGLDVKPEDYEPPLNGFYYLIGYAEGVAFALACFYPFRDGSMVHLNVLKAYRLKYARDFVKEWLYMIKCPLYAEIPTNRKRFINFVKKFSFDSIPNNKDSTDTVLMRLKDGFY